ncbi:MAG: ABC transporter permease [Proteobacteria bacterium]|nr:ABC transporter permease [Pseudomonadota bacterium]MCZ6781890.1 ABC transporter permease [Pseudomonadota bacterium]
METWVVSNIVVAVLVAGAVWSGVYVRRSEMWAQAARELWRRSPVALLVVSLYVGIALVDSVSWIGGDGVGEDTVALHEARSPIDRLFADFREESYSAPLAAVTFSGETPLLHPGTHLFGTDLLGRDILHQVLKGARIALLIGGVTSLLAIPLALFFGVSAGYFGGRTDDAVFFLMSVLSSIPSLLLLIVLVMVMDKSTLSVCIALAVTSWVGFCRISRGETLKLRELEYVQAARALGIGPVRIMYRHILPNLMHLVVITFVLMFSGLVLSEVILSWLGIGVDGSWGRMIDQARDELSRDPIVWWNLSAAGAALFGLLLAVNFVGDAVRDILDPRTLRENL